jgi:hypothetical protein
MLVFKHLLRPFPPLSAPQQSHQPPQAAEPTTDSVSDPFLEHMRVTRKFRQQVAIERTRQNNLDRQISQDLDRERSEKVPEVQSWGVKYNSEILAAGFRNDLVMYPCVPL